MKLKGVTTYEVPWRYFIVIAPLVFLMKLWLLTLRTSVENKELEKLLRSPEPFIILFWHNKIFSITRFKQMLRKNYPMCGLVSPSKDGAWLAAAFKVLGITTVRGSSKRRGGVAIKELVDILKEGSDIAITPDGPRGPIYTVKKGALKVAELSGIRMFPVTIEYKNSIKFNSWDKFEIPLPFSKVILKPIAPLNYEELVQKASANGQEPEEFLANLMNAKS